MEMLNFLCASMIRPPAWPWSDHDFENWYVHLSSAGENRSRACLPPASLSWEHVSCTPVASNRMCTLLVRSFAIRGHNSCRYMRTRHPAWIRTRKSRLMIKSSPGSCTMGGRGPGGHVRENDGGHE